MSLLQHCEVSPSQRCQQAPTILTLCAAFDHDLYNGHAMSMLREAEAQGIALHPAHNLSVK